MAALVKNSSHPVIFLPLPATIGYILRQIVRVLIVSLKTICI